jgi:hypothetical protein
MSTPLWHFDAMSDAMAIRCATPPLRPLAARDGKVRSSTKDKCEHPEANVVHSCIHSFTGRYSLLVARGDNKFRSTISEKYHKTKIVEDAM